MNIYKVLCEPMSSAFAGINRFDPNAVIEFTGEFNEEDKDVYEIETKHSIDHLLDASDGVIKWSKI